jgi:hypothetical protein
MDGVQESVIRNNLIYANKQNGLRAYVIDAAEGPKGLRIINNTISVPLGAGGWCVRITEDLGDNLVRNCILLSDDPMRGAIALDNTKGFASDHNLVVDRFTPDRDDTILSLAEWQALGYDTASAVASGGTLFVQAGSDFHLQAGCAGVDTGSAELAPNDDLDGNSRPRGSGIDIGCYEYGASPPSGDVTQKDASTRDAILKSDAVKLSDGRRPDDAGKPEKSASSNDGASAKLVNEGCGCAVSRGPYAAIQLSWLFVVFFALRRRFRLPY